MKGIKGLKPPKEFALVKIRNFGPNFGTKPRFVVNPGIEIGPWKGHFYPKIVEYIIEAGQYGAPTR